MDTPNVFLLIFVVSFVMTLVSFFLGVADVSFGGHSVHGLNHGHVFGPHELGHADLHGLHGPHVELGHGHGGGGGGHGLDADGISPFNMATALAFFTWFGGAGYLLTGYAGVVALLAVVIAAGVGLVGAAAVFFFMARVLLPGQTPYMSADDFDMAGTIGRLTVGIRAGGTGELVYSKAGSRRVASARSEDDSALERDAEVVVVRQEGSIVFVEPIETFMQSSTIASGAPDGARR